MTANHTTQTRHLSPSHTTSHKFEGSQP